MRWSTSAAGPVSSVVLVHGPNGAVRVVGVVRGEGTLSPSPPSTTVVPV